MSWKIESAGGAAFLPYDEMKELMISEFKNRFGETLENRIDYGDLVFVPGFSFKNLREEYSPFPAEGTCEKKVVRHVSDNIPFWCRCAMTEPFFVRFDSIGDAAQALKSVQRSWSPYNHTLFRRSALIQEKLPYVNLKDRTFPFDIPQSPVGLYTLIDEHTLLASAKTSSCLPSGKITWIEDHENPPSRAYLKVQESLVLARHYFGAELPGPGTKCFEAGACPGGWTWVLSSLGAEVFAVDRSPLAESLMENPLVTFMAHDAFTLKPEALGHFDWIFSDVICYPERLLEWIKQWIESGLVDNMICTIKMQGEIDWNLVAEFEKIPDSRIFHLNYNKHELTFIHCKSD